MHIKCCALIWNLSDLPVFIRPYDILIYNFRQKYRIFFYYHTETSESSSATDTITSEDHHIINISDELQDELCQLWDMSSDSDVAKLLQEYKAVDILTEVISKSDAPRATVSSPSYFLRL